MVVVLLPVVADVERVCHAAFREDDASDGITDVAEWAERIS
jgi:hypothetical protein